MLFLMNSQHINVVYQVPNLKQSKILPKFGHLIGAVLLLILVLLYCSWYLKKKQNK